MNQMGKNFNWTYNMCLEYLTSLKKIGHMVVHWRPIHAVKKDFLALSLPKMKQSECPAARKMLKKLGLTFKYKNSIIAKIK